MYQAFKNKKLRTYIEETDNCNDCTNQTDCSLVGALSTGMVLIDTESMSVDNCGMYIKKSDNNIKNITKFRKTR